MRFWGRVGALLVFLLFCLPAHLFTYLLWRDSRWPRRFLAGAARLCGLRVAIAGRPLRQDAFFIANHISWLDILVVSGATGCAFVSRDDVANWPLIGWLAKQNNTVFVSRASRGAVHGQIGSLRTAMERHQPVALFPEGTTGDGHALLPFKASLFAVLLPPPRAIRVQPVLIDYGPATDAIAWIGEEPAGVNARRVLARRGRTTVTLHFLDPFDPGDHPDRKAIAARAHAELEGKLRSLRAEAQPV